MAVDFEKQLTEVARSIMPGVSLASETIPIAISCLEEIDQNYGPEGIQPLAFHDAEHSLGVSRRAVYLTNLLYPYVKPWRRPRIFDISFLGGSGHDLKQEYGPGVNETLSFEGIASRVRETDGELNSETFISRLGHAVVATAVTIGSKGELVQENLLKGSHDPVKFIVAFSDINGIAMEGKRRMLEDATNVYLEMTSDPTEDGLTDFLACQKQFLRQRLNDKRMKPDIAYFFPDSVQEVYEAMGSVFRENIHSAFDLTVDLNENSELRTSVKRVVSYVVGDKKPRLGYHIAEAIRKVIQP